MTRRPVSIYDVQKTLRWISLAPVDIPDGRLDQMMHQLFSLSDRMVSLSGQRYAYGDTTVIFRFRDVTHPDFHDAYVNTMHWITIKNDRDRAVLAVLPDPTTVVISKSFSYDGTPTLQSENRFAMRSSSEEFTMFVSILASG